MKCRHFAAILPLIAMLAACQTISRDSVENAAWRQPAAAGVIEPKLKQAAEAAWNEGNFAHAANYYGMLHDAVPDEHDITLRYGEALRQSGQTDKAVTVLAAAAQRPSANSRILAALARAHLQQGEILPALREAQRAVDADPSDGGAFLVLGITLEALDEGEPAARAFAKARQFNAPDMARTLGDTGLSFARSGDHAAAARLLRLARQIDPQDPSIALNLRMAESLSGGSGMVRPPRTTSPTRLTKPTRLATVTPGRSAIPSAPAYTPQRQPIRKLTHQKLDYGRLESEANPRPATLKPRSSPMPQTTSGLPPLRFGRHAEFTRLVLEDPSGVRTRFENTDQGIVLPLPQGVTVNMSQLKSAFAHLTNRLILQEDSYGAPFLIIEPAPGVRMKDWYIDNRLILDFFPR